MPGRFSSKTMVRSESVVARAIFLRMALGGSISEM